MNDVIVADDVKSRMMMVRGQASLLDRDVAALYGMETREVVQALRNNPDKFPAGYVVQLNAEEFKDWRSKILTSNLSDAEKTAIKMGLRRAPYAFTEKGIYMLATILKGERAVKTTIKIIETYAQLRSMVADEPVPVHRPNPRRLCQNRQAERIKVKNSALLPSSFSLFPSSPIAHRYSDEYVNVSILDREAVLKVARGRHIDGILSFGVDPGVVTYLKAA